MTFLKKGKKLPEHKKSNKFMAGTQAKELCEIYKIERTYRIFPDSNFDPKSYLQKHSVKMGDYNATIDSKHFKLEGIKLQKDGRVMMLSTSTFYPVSNKAS